MSDGDLRALVVRARSGDAAAFTQIVLQLQDAIVGYAWSVLRDRQRGEDAAQEAFLEASLRQIVISGSVRHGWPPKA